MNSRKLSLITMASVCAVLIGALFAGLSAAAPGDQIGYSGTEWLVNGTTIAPGKTEPISISSAQYSQTTFKFGGYAEGPPLTKVSCNAARVGSSSFLESGGKGVLGSLNLSGCQVLTPPNCSITNGEIVSNVLSLSMSGRHVTLNRAYGGGLFIIHLVGEKCISAGNRIFGSGGIEGILLNPRYASMTNQPIAFPESATVGSGEPATFKGALLFAAS